MILIERIRARVYDLGERIITGTATELCLQFGYDDPNEFGTAINEVERKVSELGIDIEKVEQPRKD